MYLDSQTFLDDRLEKGVWGNEEAHNFQSMLLQIENELERDALTQQLMIAINSDRVRFEADLPLFSN